jgi:TRAP-type C4-dicarboxylate transport system permease large subunit
MESSGRTSESLTWVRVQLFAALSGSSPATCAAIGTMGIPEMRQRGYSEQIASSGTIAAGGTLGVLIPPSIDNDCLWNCNRNINRSDYFYGRNLVPGIMLGWLMLCNVGHFSNMEILY